MSKKRPDLTGQTFNDLYVVRKISSDGKYDTYLCKCLCGNTLNLTSRNIKDNVVKRCKDCRNNLRFKSVLSSKSDLYRKWQGMKKRCTCYKDRHIYKYYVSKGITYYNKWNDYLEFEKWSLSNGYKEGLSLDRIDNCKGYFPSNCRWVNFKYQQRNKNNTVYITYLGKTKSLCDWYDELEGISVSRKTVYRRVRDGWNIEDAFFKPKYFHYKELL